MRKRVCCAVLLFLMAAVPAAISPIQAQTTSATLTGRATVEGKGVPGVTVTLTSPALQSNRIVTTGDDGEFTAVALPPGPYTVTFELAGLQPAVRNLRLAVAGAARADAELTPRAMAESVIVEPYPLSVTSSPQVATNLSGELVEFLPSGRTIIDTVLLAPGVQNSGPSKQPIINGAPSYDNLYLVNGVTINDQIRGQPHKLFIEDAIQETTVLTAGISAEYGRFTGGVVNVITRSGGNNLTGSLRDTLSSDRWTARTPYVNEPEHLRSLNHDLEGTLGGRVLRDRLWFFLAGRYDRRENALATLGNNIPFTHGTSEDRMEAKLTGALSPKHSVVGSWMDVRLRENNVVFDQVADLNSLWDTTTPNSLLALYYTGILRQDTVVEGQFSKKQYALRGGNSGIAVGDLIHGTPVFGLENGWLAAAPVFCAACGPSRRDNRDLLVKASWFGSTPRFGDHTLVAGVDDFHELRNENSRQSASDFVIYGNVVTFGSQNYVQFVPDETEISYSPVLFPGDRPADFSTRSAFVNDRVALGSRFAFNLGLRYDANRGHDSLGVSQAKDNRFSPRLGATWDLRGNGMERLNATFSRYASKVQQIIAGNASPADTPALYYYVYEGPEINVDPAHAVPAAEALRQLFAWFQSVGGVNNEEFLLGGGLPGQMVVRGQLVAPVMDETTLGYGHQFSNRGMLRADYIQRRWSDFYVTELTTANGKIPQPGGTQADRIFVSNGGEGLSRRYHAVAMQGGYRIARFSLGGNYTWSRLTGNVEGEAAGSAAVPMMSPSAYQPEYRGFTQNAPMGYLSGDIRNRANVWAGYDIPTRYGRFVATMLERYQSPRSYSAVANVDVRSIHNPGYANAPTQVPYYVFGRGTLRTDAVSSTGVGLNYATAVRGAQFLAEVDVENIFNQHAVEDPSFVNRQVTMSRSDRNLAAFNPFTTVPVACPQGVATSSAQCKGITNYQVSKNFGLPTDQKAYQTPRTVRLSFGVRF
jgi:hypothetical protein